MYATCANHLQMLKSKFHAIFKTKARNQKSVKSVLMKTNFNHEALVMKLNWEIMLQVILKLREWLMTVCTDS